MGCDYFLEQRRESLKDDLEKSLSFNDYQYLLLMHFWDRRLIFEKLAPLIQEHRIKRKEENKE